MLVLDVIIEEDGTKKVVDIDTKGRIREVYAFRRILLNFWNYINLILSMLV